MIFGNCPICDTSVNRESDYYHDDAIIYKCNQCGNYSISKEAEERLNSKNADKEKLKSALFYYLRVIKENHKSRKPLLLITNERTTIENAISLKEIYTIYPRAFNEKVDKIMELLNTKITDVDEFFEYPQNISGKYDCRFLLPSKELSSEAKKNFINRQSWVFIETLLEMGFIKECGQSGTDKKYTFTSRGWEKIDFLQRQNKSSTVFIAMSFDRTNTKFPLSTGEDAIHEAIRKAGYVPIIIKNQEHNHSIPEEIMYEIKRAAFVITDLTLQNNGAYYEAGLAKGLGKEVVFTCHKGDFKDVHFDTKQINTIIWDDKDEFIDNLYRRIKFTIGEREDI